MNTPPSTKNRTAAIVFTAAASLPMTGCRQGRDVMSSIHGASKSAQNSNNVNDTATQNTASTLSEWSDRNITFSRSWLQTTSLLSIRINLPDLRDNERLSIINTTTGSTLLKRNVATLTSASTLSPSGNSLINESYLDPGNVLVVNLLNATLVAADQVSYSDNQIEVALKNASAALATEGSFHLEDFPYWHEASLGRHTSVEDDPNVADEIAFDQSAWSSPVVTNGVEEATTGRIFLLYH